MALFCWTMTACLKAIYCLWYMDAKYLVERCFHNAIIGCKNCRLCYDVWAPYIENGTKIISGTLSKIRPNGNMNVLMKDLEIDAICTNMNYLSITAKSHHTDTDVITLLVT
jgi:hypothetical protein